MSKRIIDLSWPMPDSAFKATHSVEHPGTDWRYHGYVCIGHAFDCDARAGCPHLELASHCVPDPNVPKLERFASDDICIADIPIEQLYEIPTTFLRLNREGLGPAITAEELDEALTLTGADINSGDALLIQAQKTACKIAMPEWQYMYFSSEAGDWIAAKKVRLFGSDTWENHDTKTEKEPRSVRLFYKMFKAGIWSLVSPNNMDNIRKNRIKITVLPLIAKVTVITCRAVAIEESGS